MSSTDYEPERVEAIRAALGHMVDVGASPAKIGDYAGCTGQAVRDFINGKTDRPGTDKLRKFEEWAKGEWRKAGPDRRSLAEILRWFADVLDSGDPIPWVRLSRPDIELDDFQPGGGRSVNGDDPESKAG